MRNGAARSGLLRQCAGRIVLGLMIVAGVSLFRPALCDPPTLYERIAAGPLVVHGQCFALGKRASILVVEVLRGSYEGKTIQISFRGENYNRTPGSPKIEFALGTESVLVLSPEKDDRGRLKGADRFFLAGGIRGKIDLPLEGGAAVLQAARRLTAIQKLGDQTEVWSAQRDLIKETNPILVGAGFEEILKFRLGEEALVMPLVTHVEGPRPEFRRYALRVIAQMFERQRRTGKELTSSDLLTQETLSRATGDESPETRVEAVRTLRMLQRPDLAPTLSRLASSDPSQMVRYEAELALNEIRNAPDIRR